MDHPISLRRDNGPRLNMAIEGDQILTNDRLLGSMKQRNGDREATGREQRDGYVVRTDSTIEEVEGETAAEPHHGGRGGRGDCFYVTLKQILGLRQWRKARAVRQLSSSCVSAL